MSNFIFDDFVKTTLGGNSSRPLSRESVLRPMT